MGKGAAISPPASAPLKMRDRAFCTDIPKKRSEKSGGETSEPEEREESRADRSCGNQRADKQVSTNEDCWFSFVTNCTPVNLI